MMDEANLNPDGKLAQAQVQAPRAAPASMPDRLGRLGRLVRKELLEILRDRRTIITLVLMPILLYPLLSLAFQQLAVANKMTPQAKVEVKIGYPSPRDYEIFRHYMHVGGQRLRAQSGEPEGPAVELNDPRWSDDLESAVRDRAVALGVRIRNAEAIQQGRAIILDCELLYLPDSAAARAALDFVESRLTALYAAEVQGQFAAAAAAQFDHRTAQRVAISGAAAGALMRRDRSIAPAGATRHPLVQREAAGAVSLASLVPLVLILMTITGAVYPAIDLTAGERERGTLEILVAAPVPRLGLLFAKYVTVLTVAVMTALINLTMMIITLVLTLGPQLQLSVIMVVQIFGLLLLFAAFFSAVLLTLTSFARSFKEAQAYLIPLMLVSLAPGLMGMFGLRLEGMYSVVPLLNIVLLGRDLFEGGANPAMAAVVVTSTLLYALAAIAVASRIFGAESVLYNEQSNWADLFRRPRQTHRVPSVVAALLCLAFMFPTWFFLHGLIRIAGPDFQARLLLVPLVSIVLFAGLPLLSAAHARVRFPSGFQWRNVPPVYYAAAVLLGVSLWPLILQLIVLQMGGLNANLERYEEFLGFLSEARQIPLAVMIVLMVVPAVVEELFFRGYLFSALRAVSGPAATIIITAVLFGFFHLITEGFGFGRLLPSTLMGLVLGWVCWQTGSVVPGMILHGLHNGILVAVGQSGVPTAWRAAAGGAAAASLPAEEPGLPITWLLAGALGTVIGVALILLARKRFPADPTAPADSPLEPSAAIS